MAVLAQHRPDAGLEKLDARRIWILGMAEGLHGEEPSAGQEQSAENAYTA
jgi:hypothetical protein